MRVSRTSEVSKQMKPAPPWNQGPHFFSTGSSGRVPSSTRGGLKCVLLETQSPGNATGKQLQTLKGCGGKNQLLKTTTSLKLIQVFPFSQQLGPQCSARRHRTEKMEFLGTGDLRTTEPLVDSGLSFCPCCLLSTCPPYLVAGSSWLSGCLPRRLL